MLKAGKEAALTVKAGATTAPDTATVRETRLAGLGRPAGTATVTLPERDTAAEEAAKRTAMLWLSAPFCGGKISVLVLKLVVAPPKLANSKPTGALRLTLPGNPAPLTVKLCAAEGVLKRVEKAARVVGAAVRLATNTVRSTSAGAYVGSPFWRARSTISPAPVTVTVFPLMVAGPDLTEMSTFRLEDEDAETVNVRPGAKVWFAGCANVMVCALRGTDASSDTPVGWVMTEQFSVSPTKPCPVQVSTLTSAPSSRRVQSSPSAEVHNIPALLADANIEPLQTTLLASKRSTAVWGGCTRVQFVAFVPRTKNRSGPTGTTFVCPSSLQGRATIVPLPEANDQIRLLVPRPPCSQKFV